ncbi:hypothetical protein [Mesorhizobium sp. CN2-181]|uniref:calcium-binding protein n=1 Tax=Mesorhizobium yinganensis TaxID=3157707 RepID=UPI0032B72617
MTTVTMSFPGGEYLPEYVDYNPSLGQLLNFVNTTVIGTPSATRITFRLESGLVVKLIGTGFTYDTNGEPTGGTLTGLQVLLEDGVTLLQNATGFNLSLLDVYDAVDANTDGEDDFLYFFSWQFTQWLMNSNDTINGSLGSDDLYGHAGNDVLKGGADDDYLEGGIGKDTYDGGSGFDTLMFQDTYFDPTALRGIVLDAQAGTVLDPWGNSETFTSIEAFRGTQFADILNGSSVDEQFFGLGGRDKIDGKGGVDEVRYDRDDHRNGFDGVTVSLTSGVAIDGFGK